MNTLLKTFDGHIPDSILEENIELRNLLQVLNGMQSIREDEIFNYIRSFVQPLVSDLNIAKKYVDEWKAEYTQNSSLKCIDCLYRNFYTIYSGKGTFLSLSTLIKCLLWVEIEPQVTITDYVKGKPLILFSDKILDDWLPDDSDIWNEVGVTDEDKIWCPTLLGDSWEPTYTTVNIDITCGYVPTDDFITFLKETILLYLPMLRGYTNLNLNFL